MENFSDRLKYAVEQKGWNNKDFARKASVSESQASKYLSGNMVPHTKRKLQLANVLGVDVAWLNGGEIDTDDENVSHNSGLPIPLYDSIKVKGGILATESTANIHYPFELIDHKVKAYNCFAYRMPDDSMSPTIQKGSLMLFDTENKEYGSRSPYICAVSEMVYVCHLVAKPDGKAELMFINKNHQSIEMSRKHILIIGMLKNAFIDFSH